MLEVVQTNWKQEKIDFYFNNMLIVLWLGFNVEKYEVTVFDLVWLRCTLCVMSFAVH